MARLVQRLFVMLAFAAAMLAPALARAVTMGPQAAPNPAPARPALVPACEVHEFSAMPSEWLKQEPASDACSTADRDAQDDLGDPRVAAMCDARGASVIAPPRILSIADARIDVASGQAFELGPHIVGPSPHDSPASGPSYAIFEQATLDDVLVVPPAPCELAPPYPPVEGGARQGVARGIDHPPR
jgi:hypothetical protein